MKQVLKSRLCEKFNKLEAYVPGEQPQDKKYIKLNTNESPFPPSPEVIKAISQEKTASLNLYSNPRATELVCSIAAYYDVAPENVFVGNGSDEVLALSFYGFCDSKRGIAFPDITYGFYEVYCGMFGIKPLIFPLDDDLKINPVDYMNVGANNIILANPNAQTGCYLPPEAIEAIILANPDNIVIIDEAYIDFGGESVIPLIKKYDNLIVIQTFSKSRSLAGGRVGFAVASSSLIADLNTMKYSFNPYNINTLSIFAATAAMNDKNYMRSCCDEVIRVRESFKKQLRNIDFRVSDSMSNFLLAEHKKISGKALYAELKKRGFLVRYLGIPRIENSVRITVGTEKQMSALLSEIKDILELL